MLKAISADGLVFLFFLGIFSMVNLILFLLIVITPNIIANTNYIRLLLTGIAIFLLVYELFALTVNFIFFIKDKFPTIKLKLNERSLTIQYAYGIFTRQVEISTDEIISVVVEANQESCILRTKTKKYQFGCWLTTAEQEINYFLDRVCQ